MGTQAVRRVINTTSPQPTVKVNQRLEIEPNALQPTTFKPFAAAVASVGTPVTIWTPTSGLRWRVLGWTVSASGAAAAVFKEASVAAAVGTRFVSAIFAANGQANAPVLGNGFSAASRNNQLVLDSTVAGVTYTGTVYGVEEAGD